MTIELPDFDPHLLGKQVAVLKEQLRRKLITEEYYQEQYARVHDEHHKRQAAYIAAGYQKFDIPKMEQEFDRAITRKARSQAARTSRWLYPWNIEPEEDLWDFSVLWRDDTEQQRARSRQRATGNVAPAEDFVVRPLDWLWEGRLPLGNLSLLTGDSSEGKSLIALDLIARVTTGAGWPDGTPGGAPADALLIARDRRLTDVVFPRLHAARADLARVRVLSWVHWQDGRSGERDGAPFQLPIDGPVLDRTLENSEHLRLVVIDSLSDCLRLPAAASEWETALHDVLEDLEELANTHRLGVLCVETARPGGLIRTASGRQWRAHFDTAFAAVWGVARDPRDRGSRLLLPIRHHLGDDRTGYQFSIEPCDPGTARIAWGEPEDSLTYAEATGRVRLGRGIWSFSQTADAEAWLRVYLREGEKPSVEIFSEARERGFTEHPVRDALRRVASKYKQQHSGSWYWKLKSK